MSNSKRFQIETLSKGFVAKLDTSEKGTYYSEIEDLIHETLTNHELTKGLNDENNYFLEVLAYNESNSNESPKVQVGTKGWKDNHLVQALLQRDADPKLVDIESIRLSVNERNSYSPEKLKKIDFIGLRTKYNLTKMIAAEIAGADYQVYYQMEKSIEDGSAKFQRVETRKRLTILSKYYDAIEGLKSTLKEEMENNNTVIKECILALAELEAVHGHISSKKLTPILEKLKSLTK